MFLFFHNQNLKTEKYFPSTPLKEEKNLVSQFLEEHGNNKIREKGVFN
jgi:hypothetical protein